MVGHPWCQGVPPCATVPIANGPIGPLGGLPLATGPPPSANGPIGARPPSNAEKDDSVIARDSQDDVAKPGPNAYDGPVEVQVKK